MNIGMFTDTYLPQVNGVATSVSLFKRYLEARGHKVYIFAPCKPESEERAYLVPSFPFLFQMEHKIALPQFFEFDKILKELKLDILHSHAPFSMGFFAMKIQKKYSIPHVHTYHTLLSEYRHYIPAPLRPDKNSVEKFSAYFCNQMDGVIAPTKEIKNELLRYGVETEIYTLPTGVDMESFEGKPNIDVRGELGIPKNSRILITVGRIAKEKNFEFVIRVFEYLYKQYKDIFLVLVGDGPQRKELEHYVESHNIDDRVRFTGYIKREHLIDYYKSSYLFVFASHTETQGLVLCEAMSAGIPVVAIGDMGVLDVVEDGNGGLLIYNEDVEKFAAAVKRLLNDEAYYREMSKRAKRHVMEHWSMDVMVTRLEKIYENVIQSTERQKGKRYNKIESKIWSKLLGI